MAQKTQNRWRTLLWNPANTGYRTAQSGDIPMDGDGNPLVGRNIVNQCGFPQSGRDNDAAGCTHGLTSKVWAIL
jgi:hypothetical protein